jgi:hypothetical protein
VSCGSLLYLELLKAISRVPAMDSFDTAQLVLAALEASEDDHGFAFSTLRCQKH